MPADPVTLDRLRQRIAQLERGGALAGTASISPHAGNAASARLSFGLAAVDDHLPGGGLAAAAMHEILDGDGDPGAAHGAAATGFAAALAGRCQQASPHPAACPVVWIAPRNGLRESLYRHGLSAFGLDPDALLVVRISGRGRNAATQTLWALEECLRERTIGLVCAEIDTLDLTASRRLQLAAAAGHTTGLLLRGAGAAAIALSPTASMTRWRIASAPSTDIGIPRWRVELLRARNGRPRHWLLEWHHDLNTDTDIASDHPAPAQSGPLANAPKKTGFAVASPLCDRPDMPASHIGNATRDRRRVA